MSGENNFAEWAPSPGFRRRAAVYSRPGLFLHRTQMAAVLALWITSLVAAEASATRLNIDFGDTYGTPSNSFGAAAG